MRLGSAELPTVTLARALSGHAAAVVLVSDMPGRPVVVCPVEHRAALRDGEVWLWFGDPTRRGDWDEAAAELLRCSVYGARAARQRQARSRAAMLCAHAGARVLLAQALGCGPDRIAYQPTESGKPCLGEAGCVSFSLAHTDTLVAVAVSRHAVGVDVEPVRMLPDIDGLAAAELDPVLVEQLRGLPPERRVRGFFQCWTVAEAWFKATGRVISAGEAGWLDGRPGLVGLCTAGGTSRIDVLF